MAKVLVNAKMAAGDKIAEDGAKMADANEMVEGFGKIWQSSAAFAKTDQTPTKNGKARAEGPGQRRLEVQMGESGPPLAFYRLRCMAGLIGSVGLTRIDGGEKGCPST